MDSIHSQEWRSRLWRHYYFQAVYLICSTLLQFLRPFVSRNIGSSIFQCVEWILKLYLYISSKWTITLGEQNLNENETSSAVYEISNVVMHDNYTIRGHLHINDIAVCIKNWLNTYHYNGVKYEIKFGFNFFR